MRKFCTIATGLLLASSAGLSGLAAASGINNQSSSNNARPVYVDDRYYSNDDQRWDRDRRHDEHGGQVMLFDQDGFHGRKWDMSHSSANIDQEVHNKASSMIVTDGRWEVCQHPQFGGHCVVVGPGRYPDLRSLGLDNSISSLRRVEPGYQARR